MYKKTSIHKKGVTEEEQVNKGCIVLNLYILTVLLSKFFIKLSWQKVILSWPRGLNQDQTRQQKGNPVLAESVDDLPPCAPDDKGQVHHIFSPFMNARIYKYFSQKCLCFVFLEGRKFLLRSKMMIYVTVHHN